MYRLASSPLFFMEAQNIWSPPDAKLAALLNILPTGSPHKKRANTLTDFNHTACGKEQITRQSLTFTIMRRLKRNADLESYLRRSSSSWSSFWWLQSTSTCQGCKRAQRCEGRGCHNRRPERWAPPSWGNIPPAKKKKKINQARGGSKCLYLWNLH